MSEALTEASVFRRSLAERIAPSSLSAVVDGLRIAPRDLLERMVASYPLAVGTSKGMLTALVQDTFDLVEQQLPEIDVERLRAILAHDRPLWDDGRGAG